AWLGEPLLHLFELTLERIDLAAAARIRRAARLLARRLAAARLTGAAGERREHREGALEHFHVAADLILERTERTRAEGLRHLVAEFLRVFGQRADRCLEVAWHQHLHAVAIAAAQLAQEPH